MTNPVRQAAYLTPSAASQEANLFPAQFTNDKIAHNLLKGSLCCKAVKVSASSIAWQQWQLLHTVCKQLRDALY